MRSPSLYLNFCSFLKLKAQTPVVSCHVIPILSDYPILGRCSRHRCLYPALKGRGFQGQGQRLTALYLLDILL